MRKLAIPMLVTALLFVMTFVAIGATRGQTPLGPIVLSQETQSESVREIVALEASTVPQQPNIGFIDSPSATCYMPDPGQDSCYINWYYIAVDASPNYMITMTATLNDFGPVAHTQGFFQTPMYIPYNMLGQGFKVPCGDLGAGGNPHLGNAYAYTIRARDSAGLSSANYGTVYCPPFNP